jgi:hypothetical protein
VLHDDERRLIDQLIDSLKCDNFVCGVFAMAFVAAT